MTQVYQTRSQLVQAILEELKVTAVGQPPHAEEWSVVDDNIERVAAELAALKITYVDNLDEVPIEVFKSTSQVMARQFANKFSIPTDETDKMFYPENSPFSPESKLRAMRRSVGVYPPLTPDYF